MIINISTEQLLSMHLDVDQYVLCMALYTNSKDSKEYFGTFPISRSKIEPLIDRKILRSVSTNITSIDNLRVDDKKFQELLNVKPVSAWYKEWFDLWPVGVKSGGYYVRNDQSACKTKLSRFVKRYPQYSKEIIMEATSRYLFQRSLNGYEYTKLATNFIDQDGVSVLAGECENILKSTETERPKIVQGELFGSNEL